MWIASKYGWFSIVEKNPGVFHVRARVGNDLKNLVRAASIAATIEYWPDADYRYRIIISRQQRNKVFQALQSSIDYPNFKSEIAKTPDQCDKLSAYHTIWATMAAFQDATAENA